MADPKKSTEEWSNSRGNYPANTPYLCSADNQTISPASLNKYKDPKMVGKCQNEEGKTYIPAAEDGQKKKSTLQVLFQNPSNSTKKSDPLIQQPEFGTYDHQSLNWTKKSDPRIPQAEFGIHDHKCLMGSLQGQIQSLRRENVELQNKIDLYNHHHHQDVITQFEFPGSYEDGEPTPLLLQRAATTVKHSLIQCADALFRFHRSNPKFEFHLIATSDQSNPPLNLHKSEHDHTASVSARKNKLRAILSSLVFSEFEIFPISAVFQQPDLPLKRNLFQSYIDCKSSDERTEQNYEDMSLFADLDTTAAANHDTPIGTDDFHRFLLSKLRSSNLHKNVNLMGDKDFRSSFVRLARRVWLLQKLVFSFALTPEIFRVPQGSAFDNDYMEDCGHRSAEEHFYGEDNEIDTNHDGQEDGNNHNSIAMNLSVALMLVPGFVIRGNVNHVSIIKSQVICCHS